MERSRDHVLMPVARWVEPDSGFGSGAGIVQPGPRVVGPGRRERSYQRRVDALERDLGSVQGQALVLVERVRARERELELAERVERGSQRRQDRLEERLVVAEQHKSQLLLTMGALQRENEALRKALSVQVLNSSAGAAPRSAQPRLAKSTGRGASSAEVPAGEPGESSGSRSRTSSRRASSRSQSSWLGRLFGS